VDVNALDNFQTGFPALSIDASDVVYLMSKGNPDDRKALVVTINMRKKTLEGLAPFSAERCMYTTPGYVACTLSKYLNTNSGDSYARTCFSIMSLL
jgi:hypothetical protein